MDNPTQQSKMERYQRMFLDECDEHVGVLERTLPAMRDGDRSAALIDDAFRAAHSIKGGAGMVGFTRIVPFAHRLEAVLDAVRIAQIATTPGLVSCMLSAVDCLSDLLLAASKDVDLPPGFETPHLFALAEISGISFDNETVAQSLPIRDEKTAEVKNWAINFKPYKGVLRRANDPLLILRQLRDMGAFTLVANVSELPPFAELEPMDSYLSWQMQLTTTEKESVIRSAFEFVSGDCDLDIVIADFATTHDERKAIPNVEGDVRSKASTSKTIRVDLDRIDKLVNLSGEIAISQALVAQLIDQNLFNEKPLLFQELSQLLQHTQNLQDGVMAIRAQPIRTIFDRMPRLVRELSESTGKKFVMRTSGENTEIDKTVIEMLSDPIVHMIRNAADHGIESVAQRKAAGKPEEGIIKLSAEQRGSRIIIEVSDDGRGIDREAVRRRAISRNLISSDTELTQDEIDALIFLPGFTTTENVTNISGRGVGMDVVKRNIQKLGGRISIRSVPGQGSVISLTLPLTLAVLEGMIVRSGDENYIIPVSNVFECRASWRKETRSVPGRGQIMHLRGSYVSVVQMHEVFGTRKSTDIDSSVAIIAELEGGEQLALVVDEIIGQQQVVVKSITENLNHVPGIAGATILGNGRVALIIDPTEIGRMHARMSAVNNPSLAGGDTKRNIA
ncbi:MAG: chemotaxis protein CheA [Pseudomonadota bacterium]|nr:chemotaxis protein CheA [Pseudomonadota bacterium]